MKVFILSILVAVCYAQTPPAKPVIAETFQAKVEAMVYEDDEMYHGEGTIAIDHAKNKGVENLNLFQGGRNESQIILERFDMGKEFYITGSGKEEHCQMLKVNRTTIPSYWGWLKDASYAGTRQIQQTILDVWKYKEFGVLLELLVDQDNPNVPRYLDAELNTTREETIFLSFDAVEPSAALFNIPKVCQENAGLLQKNRIIPHALSWK